MPEHGSRRRAATKVTSALVVAGLCAALLAVLFIGGRLWWLSFSGSEPPPPAQSAALEPQPAASGQTSAPSTAVPPAGADAAPIQPSVAPPVSSAARQAVSSASTVSVQLAWDSVQDPNVTGYMIRYGTEPGIYPESQSAGNHTSATLTGLHRATRYYIVVVSVDAQGNQSRPSNEVQVLTAQ